MFTRRLRSVSNWKPTEKLQKDLGKRRQLLKAPKLLVSLSSMSQARNYHTFLQHTPTQPGGTGNPEKRLTKGHRTNR